MGLRGRLALFFLAITVVPLLVGVVVLQLQIDAQVRERSGEELRRTGASAAAVAEAARARAGDLAGDLARGGAADVLAAGAPAAADAWLRAQDLQGRADVVVLAGPDGEALAAETARPAPVPGLVGALGAGLPDGPGPPGVLPAIREVRGTTPPRLLGYVVAGVWLDGELLARVAPEPPAGSGAAFLAGGQLLAVVGADPAAVPAGGVPEPGDVATTTLAGEEVLAGTTAVTGPDGGGGSLLLWTPQPGRPVPLLALGLLGVALLAAVALVWVLAGGIAAPVTRAAEFARRVAHGDVSGRLATGGGRELADLAGALNTMSAELLVDPLTRLWNRRYFDLAAEREFERAARAADGRVPLSVLVVDLDAFKTINDDRTHGGHLAGDEVLREVARRLREATRTPDVIARRGGDEFVVLLPDTGHDGAMATAERIRAALVEAPVSLAAVPDSGGAAVPVTCSVGVATRPRHGLQFSQVLKAADDALVRVAKPQGGNRVASAEDVAHP